MLNLQHSLPPALSHVIMADVSHPSIPQVINAELCTPRTIPTDTVTPTLRKTPSESSVDFCCQKMRVDQLRTLRNLRKTLARAHRTIRNSQYQLRQQEPTTNDLQCLSLTRRNATNPSSLSKRSLAHKAWLLPSDHCAGSHAGQRDHHVRISQQLQHQPITMTNILPLYLLEVTLLNKNLAHRLSAAVLLPAERWPELNPASLCKPHRELSGKSMKISLCLICRHFT